MNTYHYPQSSTQTYQCDKREYKLPTSGHPTNLSVYNCEIPDFFECYDSQCLGTVIQPDNKTGFKTLNPKLAQINYDTGFQKIKCADDKTVYVSNDPRLIDSARGLVMPLDLPPDDGSIKLDEVYTDPRLKEYGKFYRNYSDINTGQITYYVDKSIEDAFFTPVFATSAYNMKSLYQDPMSAMKPQNDRFHIKDNDHVTSKKTNYQYNLSWLDDSNEHREDLISKQMRKQNEQKWSARWS
jgi:hypothetical protein